MTLKAVLHYVSPIKLILACLFFFLGVGEFMDGIFDVGDFAVPALILLSWNDLFLNYKHYRFQSNDMAIFPNGDEIESYTDNSKKILKSIDSGAFLKVLMNFIFFIIFMSPFVLEIFNIEIEIKASIYRGVFVVWSGIFLLVSLLRLKKKFSLPSVIFSNVALILLAGAIFL